PTVSGWRPAGNRGPPGRVPRLDINYRSAGLAGRAVGSARAQAPRSAGRARPGRPLSAHLHHRRRRRGRPAVASGIRGGQRATARRRLAPRRGTVVRPEQVAARGPRLPGRAWLIPLVVAWGLRIGRFTGTAHISAD